MRLVAAGFAALLIVCAVTSASSASPACPVGEPLVWAEWDRVYLGHVTTLSRTAGPGEAVLGVVIDRKLKNDGGDPPETLTVPFPASAASSDCGGQRAHPYAGDPVVIYQRMKGEGGARVFTVPWALTNDARLKALFAELP